MLSFLSLVAVVSLFFYVESYYVAVELPIFIILYYILSKPGGCIDTIFYRYNFYFQSLVVIYFTTMCPYVYSYRVNQVAISYYFTLYLSVGLGALGCMGRVC